MDKEEKKVLMDVDKKSDDDKKHKMVLCISKTQTETQGSADLRRIVKLNVGGTFYDTTTDTIFNFPHGVLANMFNGKFQESPLHEGRYFIDRNGVYFKYILEFCREFLLPTKAKVNLHFAHHVWREARYYGLNQMMTELEALHPHCKHCHQPALAMEIGHENLECPKNTQIQHTIVVDSILSIIKSGTTKAIRVKVENTLRPESSLFRTRESFSVYLIDKDGNRLMDEKALRPREIRSFYITKDDILSVEKCALCEPNEAIDIEIRKLLPKCKKVGRHQWVRASRKRKSEELFSDDEKNDPMEMTDYKKGDDADSISVNKKKDVRSQSEQKSSDNPVTLKKAKKTEISSQIKHALRTQSSASLDDSDQDKDSTSDDLD